MDEITIESRKVNTRELHQALDQAGVDPVCYRVIRSGTVTPRDPDTGVELPPIFVPGKVVLIGDVSEETRHIISKNAKAHAPKLTDDEEREHKHIEEFEERLLKSPTIKRLLEGKGK